MSKGEFDGKSEAAARTVPILAALASELAEHKYTMLKSEALYARSSFGTKVKRLAALLRRDRVVTSESEAGAERQAA